jgi:hypothetical protein
MLRLEPAKEAGNVPRIVLSYQFFVFSFDLKSVMYF